MLLSAARKAATDPRLQAKAREAYEQNAKPVIDQKAGELRQMATERPSGEHPARFAGRALKRLLDG
ncbi:MAG: hypothetical protein CMM46_00115 [Rhodospirillaceae bacterium]|nr:hypothetical protein [Rhodospirillaceae bacterium]